MIKAKYLPDQREAYMVWANSNKLNPMTEKAFALYVEKELNELVTQGHRPLFVNEGTIYYEEKQLIH